MKSWVTLKYFYIRKINITTSFTPTDNTVSQKAPANWTIK